MRKRRILGVVGGMILSGLLSAAHAEQPAAQPEFSNAYHNVMNTLEQLQPSQQTAVALETDKDAYNIGEPVEIRFKSENACYPTLMEISANGDLVFLLPNKDNPEAKIEAGKVYSTRDNFKIDARVAASPGVEALNLFCTAKPFAFFKADFQKEPIYAIRSQDKKRLRTLLTRLNKLEKQAWAGNSALVTIHSPAPVLDEGPASAPPAPIEGKEGGKEPTTMFFMMPSKRGMLPGAPTSGTAGKRLFPPAPTTGTAGHADENAAPEPLD